MVSRALVPFVVSFVAGVTGIVASTRAEELFPELTGRLECPQVTRDATGGTWLTFVRDRREILVAHRPSGAAVWSEPRRAALVPDLTVGGRRGPRIVALPDALVITYVESRFDREARRSFGSGNLLAMRSTDGGTTWGEPRVLNRRPESAREGMHAMALGPEGRLGLVWLDLSEERVMQVVYRESRDGGRTFGEPAVVAGSADDPICPCCPADVALDGAGRTHVLWRHARGGSRDMFTAVRARDAETFGAPRPMGVGHWKLDLCPMDGGGLGIGPAGVEAVWRRERQLHHSPRVGTERSFAEGEQATLVHLGDASVAVWQHADRIHVGRLTHDDGAAFVARDLGPGTFAVALASGEDRVEVFAQRASRRGTRLVSWGVRFER